MNIFSHALLAIFHPIDNFLLIKRRRDSRVLLGALIFWVLAIVVRFIRIYITHYPLADVLPINTNILLELARMILPIFTWVIASYGVSAILNGEMKFKENLTAAMYCLIPYVICTVPISLLSNVLSYSELGLYKALTALVIIWVLILLFISIKVLNDYSFFKTVAVCFISIIGMLLLMAGVLLLMSLVLQFFSFLSELLMEIRLSGIR